MTDTTIEAAVAALTEAELPPEEADAVDDAPAAEPDAPQEPEAEPQADAEPDAEEPAEDGEDSPEAEEAADEPQAAAVPPPPFWTAEDKVAFASLPPEVQAAVVKNEEVRNSNFGRLAQQAGEAAKQYQQEAARVADVLAKAEAVIGDADYESIDWDRWYDEDPAAALRAERQWQAQARHVDDLNRVKQQAEQQILAEFLQAEAAKLPTVAPELVDPVKGPERRQALANYIASQGIAPGQIAQASAVELSLAWKAKQWDDAQAKAKAPIPRKAEPPRRPVKPTNAQGGTQSSRTAEKAVNRFSQTKSIDDAVAVLLSKG